MPHIIVVLSGAADDPIDAFDGQTPLAAATLPNLCRLAEVSEVGLLHLLPERDLDDPAVGADLATFALLGYETPDCGRGAVELLGAGAQLGRRDSGVRLDLLRLTGGLDPFPPAPTRDEATALWADLAVVCRRPDLHVAAVRPTRALGLWDEGPVEVAATPPGQLDPGRAIEAQLPTGDREEVLRRIIDDSRDLLLDHPVNRARRERAEPTFDTLWPWGFGRAPDLPLFLFRTGQVALVVADNLAVRGAARAAGVAVSRATLAERVSATIAGLDHAPTVLVHVTEADRAGHRGDAAAKRQALEQLDHELGGALLRHLREDPALEVTVLVDWACPIAQRRHASRPTPFLAFRPRRQVTGPGRLTEAAAADTGVQRYGAADLRSLLWTS